MNHLEIENVNSIISRNSYKFKFQISPNTKLIYIILKKSIKIQKNQYVHNNLQSHKEQTKSPLVSRSSISASNSSRSMLP